MPHPGWCIYLRLQFFLSSSFFHIYLAVQPGWILSCRQQTEHPGGAFEGLAGNPGVQLGKGPARATLALQLNTTCAAIASQIPNPKPTDIALNRAEGTDTCKKQA
jgi:hypothetical protein